MVARSPLLEPLQLRGARLPNRLAFVAHDNNLADGYEVGHRLVAYYRARAAGGAGTVIAGPSSVDPRYRRWGRVEASPAGAVAGFRRLAEAIDADGAVAVGQLTQDGSSGIADSRFSWDLELSPSPRPGAPGGRSPKVATAADIERSIELWASSAANQREAGFAGTEVDAGVDSLLAEFASPTANRRDDAYGGTRERRLQLLRDVLAAIRAAVGAEHLLGLRVLSADPAGGLEADEGLAMLEAIDGWKLVDWLQPQLLEPGGLERAVPSMRVAPLHGIELARRIARRVTTPVMYSGRVTVPQSAVTALCDGGVQLIGAARALIADPRWLARAREGAGAGIRPCIFCNQGCVDRVAHGRPIGCTVNPVVSREAEWSAEAPPAPSPRRVLVVGAGPAGLTTATTAARRGHDVTLVERTGAVGGDLRLAGLPSERSTFLDWAEWARAEVDANGVRVLLETELRFEQASPCEDGATVWALGAGRRFVADVTVVAVGAEWQPPALARAAAAARPATLLGADMPAGRRLLVIDDDGGHAAMVVAEVLAEAGNELVLATAALSVGQRAGTERPLLLERLYRAHVRLLTQARLDTGDAGGVALHATDGRALPEFDVEDVFYVGRRAPREALYLRLKASGAAVCRAGDAVAPRDMAMAVFSGEEVARAL